MTQGKSLIDIHGTSVDVSDTRAVLTELEFIINKEKSVLTATKTSEQPGFYFCFYTNGSITS